LSALPSEHRGDEFGVRVAPAPKVTDHSSNVERRIALSDGKTMTVVVKQQPAGGAAGMGMPALPGSIPGPSSAVDPAGSARRRTRHRSDGSADPDPDHHTDDQ
jgi:hypothetical protein